MSFVSIMIIAVSLSMDAFAVAIYSGTACPQMSIRELLRIALFFGFFQAFMPLIGYLTGSSAAPLISSIDHWVAFTLLAIIGGKMLYEGIRGEDAGSGKDPLRLLTLTSLAIATSIDAAAVGVSFSCLCVSITTPLIVIGMTTFLFSILGVQIGRRGSSLIGSKAEILGGTALIIIGLRILFEHLSA